jgi:GT2 family glycosyltransferase
MMTVPIRTRAAEFASPGSLWVVIVGFNRLDDTLECLASLERAGGRLLNVVYVDNGSASHVAGTVHARFPWCHVIRNCNEGYAGGNNRGISYAMARGADAVLILNNDTVVGDDTLRVLAEVCAASPEFGIIGPVIGRHGEPSVVMTDGCLFNRLAHGAFFWRQEIPVEPTGKVRVHATEIVNGCCMLVRSEVFRTIGMFDERFFMYHEESDFCLRAREAGFSLGLINRMLVWHKGSQSFKATGRSVQRYFDIRNLALLLRKHPTGAGRRSKVQSWLAYFRYANHRFSIEHEAQENAAANAVLEGVSDALIRRYGVYAPQGRVLVGLLRGPFVLASMFSAWRSGRIVRS